MVGTFSGTLLMTMTLLKSLREFVKSDLISVFQLQIQHIKFFYKFVCRFSHKREAKCNKLKRKNISLVNDEIKKTYLLIFIDSLMIF